MKVLVLGSQGFLGQQTVIAARARGWDVQSLVSEVFHVHRPASDPDFLDLAVGNAEQRADLLAAARGVDAIIATEPLPRHAPPRVVPMVEASLQRARVVLDVAARAGSVKLVYVGSALSVGSSVLKSGRCTAADWTLGKTDARVRAHVEIEQMLKREAENRGVPLVRVLPTRILGPGSPEPARDLKLVRAYARWRLGLFAHGGLNVLDVRDAARAVVAAAEAGEPGQRYLVGGHNLNYKEFYREIAAAIGGRHLHLALPRDLAMVLFGALEMAFLVVGRTPPLDRNFVDLHFGRYAFYDLEPAHRALGLVPRAAAETIRDSVASLRSEGLLSSAA